MEFPVQRATAEQPDRAMGVILAIETTSQMVAEGGASSPGENTPEVSQQDVLKDALDPTGRIAGAWIKTCCDRARCSGSLRRSRIGG